MFKQYKLKNYRFRLVAYVVLLCIIGVMVVGSAKPSVQNKQIIGIAGGLVVMVIVSLIDYGTILKFRRPIYLLAVVLLAVLFRASVIIPVVQPDGFRLLPVLSFSRPSFAKSC